MSELLDSLTGCASLPLMPFRASRVRPTGPDAGMAEAPFAPHEAARVCSVARPRRRPVDDAWRNRHGAGAAGDRLVRGDGYQVLEGLDLVSISISVGWRAQLRAASRWRGGLLGRERIRPNGGSPEGWLQPSQRGFGWHSCGLRSDGGVVCWGLTPTTAKRMRLRAASARSARATRHSCGLRTDGGVVCWGRNRGRPNGGA